MDSDLFSVFFCFKGRFLSNKNSALKFRIFHVPNGKVHSGCTDPTQATPCLLIVLVSRIQKSGTGDNNLVKWKDISVRPTDRNDQTGQNGPPSKVVSNIAVVPNRNFRNFGLNEMHLRVVACDRNYG